ncbi:MAG: GC-type dockerin domain-anchored protein [Planctomycetota bacterium]
MRAHKVHRSLSLVLSAAALSLTCGSASAKITVEGTPIEQKRINDAIARLEAASPTAKACFADLRARAEEVKIKIGKTADIATANGATNQVIMNTSPIECLMQINNAAGGGMALKSSSFDLILAHEVLGHLHNKIKGLPWGEPAAMAKVNKIRTEMGLPTRTAYSVKEGKKTVVPFSDGSKVDATEGLKKGNAGAPGRRAIELQAQIPVVLAPSIRGDSFDLFMDEVFPLPQINMLFPDGSTQQTELVFLDASLFPSPEPEFPAAIDFLYMDLGSFTYEGQPTAGSLVDPIPDNNRGGVGMLPLPEPLPLPPVPDPVLPLELQGDYLVQNPVFDQFGDPGYMPTQLTGELQFDPLSQTYAGNLLFQAILYAPPPPVLCVADVTTTGATLPGQPGFGEPDGAVNIDDLGYFLNAFVAGDASIADVTTTGATLEGQPGYGQPDGVVDIDDLGYFLNLFLAGCS